MTGSSHTTTYSYSNYNAYLATVTYPNTGVAHTESFSYDGPSGQLTSSTDENGQVKSYFYLDNLGRLTGINYPNCVAAGICSSTTHSVSYAYSDGGAKPSIVTTTLLSTTGSPGPLVTTAYMDGLGHPIETDVNSDSPSLSKTVTTLDGMARAWKVTNPYRSASDDTYGVATYTYDALGRPSDEGTRSIQRPDGSTVSTTYSAGTNAWCVTVVDEQGKSRTTCSDALGRKTLVTDGTGTTTYAYNGLDDLTDVYQGSQHRQFGYDSLGRETSATNPEWTAGGTPNSVTYSFDANGNVSTRTAPKPNQTGTATVVTSYGYDVLNRNTSRYYNDGVTPSVGYNYDEAYCAGISTCFNVGRRTSMTDGAGSEHWAYDRMGRLDAEQRTTASVTKNWTYSYNLDPETGVWATVYPDGRTVSLGFNSAGRLVSASDASNNYAQSAVYYAPGELNTLTEGVNGGYDIALTQTFNNRLQPNAFQRHGGWNFGNEPGLQLQSGHG